MVPRSLTRCHRDLLLTCGLAVLGACAYIPVLDAGFVWDDRDLVASSTLVKGPLADLWFTTAVPDYWPLTWTSFWLEWRIWGNNAVGYHVTNVALHLLACILLWRVLRALAIPGAWLGAALFAVHPVAVESVAWIAERKNVLSAVFFFASALSWLRFHERRCHRSLALAAVLFAMALLAKTSTVMLPVALLGVVWWRKGRIERRDTLAVAPLLALSLIAGIATIWFQHVNAMSGVESGRSVAERIGGAGWALARYVETAFAPLRVAVVYPHWPVAPASPWFFVPAVVVAALFVLLARVKLRWSRPWLAALLFHAVMVLPVLGLLDMAYLNVGPVSNHLQYLALAGPMAVVALATTRISQRFRIPGFVPGAVLVVALASSTNTRARAYESDLTLWRDAVERAPSSSFARAALSAALRDAGRMDESMAELDVVARSAPEPHMQHWAAMFTAMYRSEQATAEGHARALLSCTRDRSRRRDAAAVLLRAGDLQGGIRVLEQLVREAPRHSRYSYELGGALARAGRLTDAAQVLGAFSARTPGVMEVEEALAFVLVRLRRVDEALIHAAAVEGVPTTDPRAVARLDLWMAQPGW
jgi:protein O-mannosyl-transferase